MNDARPDWARAVEGVLRRAAEARANDVAIIHATGGITFSRLFDLATAAAPTSASTQSGVEVIESTSRPTPLVEVCAALIAGRTPLVLPPGGPHGAVRDTAQARANGCRPWRAVSSAVDGHQRTILTHGEPPTAARKAAALGMREGGRSLIAAPLHLAGPLEFALRQLLAGGSVVLLSRFTPSLWASEARFHQPDWAYLAPTQLQQLLDGLPAQPLAQATEPLRRLLHSSAPCPGNLRTALAGIIGDGKLAEYYGTALYDGTLAPYGASSPGAPPISGAALRIVGEAGQPLPAGQTGYIQGCGQTGLIHHTADAPCPVQPVWLTTGDRGLQVPGTSRIHVTSTAVPGRAIVSGVKVSLRRAQEVLEEHPHVTGATIYALDHRVTGQILAAHVTTTSAELTRADLRRWCAARLTDPERPYRIDTTHVPDPASLREDHARL